MGIVGMGNPVGLIDTTAGGVAGGAFMTDGMVDLLIAGHPQIHHGGDVGSMVAMVWLCISVWMVLTVSVHAFDALDSQVVEGVPLPSLQQRQQSQHVSDQNSSYSHDPRMLMQWQLLQQGVVARKATHLATQSRSIHNRSCYKLKKSRKRRGYVAREYVSKTIVGVTLTMHNKQEELFARTRSEEQKAAHAPPPSGGRGRGRGGRGDHPPPPPPPASGGDGFQVARGARPPPPARGAKETSEAPINAVVNKFGALDVDENDE